MSSSDAYTRPERAAEIRLAKRYRNALRKQGTCVACVHRSRDETYFGRAVCSIGEFRMHPNCETDGRGFRFTFDPNTLEALRDAA